MWPVETCRCAGVDHDWSKDSFLSACRASFGGSEHIFFNFSYISIYKDAQSVRGTECLSFIAWRPRSVEQRAGTTAHMCKQLVYGRCCSMSWTEAWRARRGEVSRSSWAGRQHISTRKKNKILKLSTEREAMQEELNIKLFTRSHMSHIINATSCFSVMKWRMARIYSHHSEVFYWMTPPPQNRYATPHWTDADLEAEKISWSS